jgi:hypothetical protein
MISSLDPGGIARTQAPRFDRSGCATDVRMKAAHGWQSLLLQEDRSRVATERLVLDLEQLHAPKAIMDRARRIAVDETRHVALCELMVRELGFEPWRPPVVLAPLPQTEDAFEQSVVELLVAGFAVAETMSVGGFAAARARTREPLARWAINQILRDEVGHGAFGEEAGLWAMADWSHERRQALWPTCVAAMEELEQRTGGPVGPRAHERTDAAVEALGAPAAVAVGEGMLRAVPRWVLPRLARLGVLRLQ